MLKEIEQLLPLQELDREIYFLRSKLDEYPPQIEKLNREIEAILEEKKDRAKGLEQKKIAHKELELELGKKESDLKKFQSQLFQVKTNKEYSALQEEIAKVKGEVSQLEDRILAMLDEIEREESALKEFSAQVDLRVNEVKARIETLEAEVKEIETKIEDLTKKREELAKTIDPKILEHYQRILEHRGGIAISPVGKDGVCGGCYRSLPPQVVNDLMLGNKIVHCETCGCILYYRE